VKLACISSVFLDYKINDYVFHPKEIEHVNLYDFIAQFDVKIISKRNDPDIMRFVAEHPQAPFRGVINRINEITHIKRTHSTDKSVRVPDHTLIIRSDNLTWKTSRKGLTHCLVGMQRYGC
jgi:hypothetical protein